MTNRQEHQESIMEKMTHTPGPWHCMQSTHKDGVTHHMIGHHRHGCTMLSLCEVLPQDSRFGDVLADCRLIATAPDLLEALRSLVRAVEERNDAAMTMHAGYAATIIAKAA